MDGLVVGYLSYGAAAVSFSALAGYYLWHGQWGSHGPFFLAAVGLTVLWAVVALLGHAVIPQYPHSTLLLQQVSKLAWIWFLWHIVASLEPYRTMFPRRLVAGWVAILLLSGLTLILHGCNLTFGLNWVNLGFFGFNSALLLLVLGLAIALTGLSMTETLYRGYHSAERWGVKFLCLAVGGLFAYDIFLYGEGLLFRALDPTFLEMRGFACALVAPLLVINIRRSQARHFGLGLSRRLVFGSTVVTGAGLYLLAMAISAFYVRMIGGTWGSAVQMLFLFVALVLLVALLLSGSFRAQVRAFLSHHVLEDKYDYRGEWLRFSGRLASTDSEEGFERRVIRALADIVDSPAGALWSVGESYLPIAAAWNMRPLSLSALDTRALEDFFRQEEEVWSLADGSDLPDDAPTGCKQLIGTLKEIPNAWVLIPMMHQDRLIGLTLLAEPRSPRALAPEDGELLVTAARQAAGLLAERLLARNLAEARQFERFNQQYAFVAHDLKNLVSQLSLMVRNYERFGDRPEFRDDMVDTIRSAVVRMEKVMARLRGSADGKQAADMGELPVDVGSEEEAPRCKLAPLLQELVAKNESATGNLTLSIAPACKAATLGVDGMRLDSVMQHLLQNAIEAAGSSGLIAIVVREQDARIIVEVQDNGPGMEAKFVENDLFMPFRTTKTGGFGIGAYQCRALAREMGGELEAISAPGAGTTMRLTLPLAGSEHTVRETEYHG